MVELASFRTPFDNSQLGSSQLHSNEPAYVRVHAGSLYGHEGLSYGQFVGSSLSARGTTRWVPVQTLEESLHDHGGHQYDRLVGIHLDARESGLRDPVGELTGANPAFWNDPLFDYGMVTVRVGSTRVPSGATGVVWAGEEIPKLPQMPSSMHPLQEWEGWVVDTDEDEFLARLTDLTASRGNSNPDFVHEEDAIIPNSEIADDDLERLLPGNVFRWVIGYERSPSGAKRRVSQIVFRDLPVVTAQDIARGEEWARKVSRALGD